MPLVVNKLNYTYLPGTPFEHHALKDVSLTIEDGSFVGIIGHTGSGKSTLMQMMSGLLKPDNGEILLDGKNIFDKSTDKKWLRSTVGVVFQYPEHQLFEETIERDIAFGPLKMGVKEPELTERIKEAMQLVNLDYEEYKDKSPFELSGGQKRKVALAGVLAMRPRVLLMDEPIAGLDPQGRESLMQLTRTLNAQGVTIVMISHNMDGLAEYADRVIAMRRGEVFLDGAPHEVFAQHEKIYAMGMGLPEVCRMVYLMNKRGMNVPTDIIRFAELKQYLAERFGGNAHD